MGRRISFWRQLAGVAVLLAVVATALSSCSWPWEHPAAAAAPAPAVDVAFPGAPSDLKAEAVQTDSTQQMKDALPSGAQVHQPVELEMKDGSFPSTGAEVSFKLDQPLPAGHQATIAYWNEQAGQWEGRATDISDDRRTITAKVEHFSTWGWVDTLYNGIGQVMGDKTSPPACPGGKPSWADPTFDDDVNGPVLWCVGTDAKNPDVLEVHLKMNRSSAGSITTGINPAWAWSDLWQNLAPVTWAKMAADSAITSSVLGEQYLVQPLGEYRFGFNRKDLDAFWHDHPNQPLIEVGSSPVYAAAGLIYQAMGEKATGGMAGVYITTSLLECGGSITGAASDQSVKQTFGAVVSCMNDRKDAIAQGMARAWSNLNPGAAADDVRAAGANIGKAVSFAGDIYATAKLTLSLGAFFGDLTVNPAARQLNFFPSNDEVRSYVRSGAGGNNGALPSGMTKYTDPDTGNSIAVPDGWQVLHGPGAHELVIDGPTKVASQLMPEEELPGEGFCNPLPYQLLDSTPVQIPGIDTSTAPTTVKTEITDYRSVGGADYGPVALSVTLWGVPGEPPGATSTCGLGGQFKHSGKTGAFWFSKGFPTPEAAKAYLQTGEYQRVKAMIGSLRFGPGYQ